jgi:transposase
MSNAAPTSSWSQAKRCQEEQAEPKLHSARRKVLESLQEHWSGLTVFVDVWDVPMDNNGVKRTLRLPVVGRKNSSGSGAVWSGWLATILFLLEAVAHGGFNPRLWLTAYLEACAAAGGQAPAEAARFLPWRLTLADKQRYGQKPTATDSG